MPIPGILDHRDLPSPSGSASLSQFHPTASQQQQQYLRWRSEADLKLNGATEADYHSLNLLNERKHSDPNHVHNAKKTHHCPSHKQRGLVLLGETRMTRAGSDPALAAALLREGKEQAAQSRSE